MFQNSLKVNKACDLAYVLCGLCALAVASCSRPIADDAAPSTTKRIAEIGPDGFTLAVAIPPEWDNRYKGGSYLIAQRAFDRSQIVAHIENLLANNDNQIKSLLFIEGSKNDRTDDEATRASVRAAAKRFGLEYKWVATTGRGHVMWTTDFSNGTERTSEATDITGDTKTENWFNDQRRFALGQANR